MGYCGISEGAISYTATDPARMIPINIISCAIKVKGDDLIKDPNAVVAQIVEKLS